MQRLTRDDSRAPLLQTRAAGSGFRDPRKMRIMPGKPLMVAVAMSIAVAQSGVTAAAPSARVAVTPTMAAPVATTFNCILASNAFAQREPDPKQKVLAEQTLNFYLGRLNPRITETQLKTAIKLTADGLKGVNAVQLMNECLADFRAKAQMLQAAGKQLQQGK